MGYMLVKASQGIASLIIVGAIGFGLFKLCQVIVKGIVADNTKGDK